MTQELRIATRNIGHIDPWSIDDYMAAGGYQALERARGMDREALLDELEKSGKLRGRGGAAFNTGTKWRGAFSVDCQEKYVICNADEGEPGTYKDRVILENDPHTVLEGMLICAYVIGAQTCYIYCRGEYREEIQLLQNAAAQVQERGISQGVRIYIAVGAGSYVCGEETALIESLSGGRGEPRLKPPFPTVSGLYGKPTVVNNVETFASIPPIVQKGADWFSAIGAARYPGTKLFALSGDVVNKICVELPTNVTLREVIEEFGGGVSGTGRLKAVQVGGSSCGFVTPDAIDTPLDFDSMRAAGAALGSGSVLVLNDSRNMAELLIPMLEFFAHESCGKCAPCREGTRQTLKLVRKIALGEGTRADMDMLRRLAEYMQLSCFCPLGQSATTALASAMELFPEDFEEKLRSRED